MSPRSHINPDRLPPPGSFGPIRRKCAASGKTAFETEREAKHEAARILREDGARFDVYECLDCLGWHFTTAPPPAPKRSERWVRAMLKPKKKRK